MLAYLQTLLLAAFALLELCGSAPTPHYAWLPQSEWGHNEPSLSSWDYLGLGNAYPLQHRVDSHESWLPQPAAPTIEIVRTYRKPAVDPSAWAQIPVIGGGRDSGRQWVALVPRGFEDFVLVRKPFVIVEETDTSAKDNKRGSKDEKNGSKDDNEEDDKPKDKKNKDDNANDRASESVKTKTPEPSSSTTTARSTSPTTSSTSTTPSTRPADDTDSEAPMEDSQPQQTKNRPQK